MSNAAVTVLLSSKGATLSIHSDPAEAQAMADRYNADPWLDCETPDTDAPYSVRVGVDPSLPLLGSLR